MINQPIELLSHAEYIRTLRPMLPDEAFRPNHRRIYTIIMHIAIMVLCYSFVKSGGILVSIVAPLIIGHNLMCMAWLGHEVSHNSVVHNHRLRYLLEVVTWSFAVIPPTLWRRVHNQTHHVHANTPMDPDRRVFLDEKTTSNKLYELFLMPNKNSKIQPFLGLTFFAYNLTNFISCILPGKTKLSITRIKPSFKSQQKIIILLETLPIAMLYYLVFRYVGSISKFMIVGPLSWPIGSAMAMSYIHTNHLDNPICEVSDPIISTTSVMVPKWVDLIHINFSYHTEHHLFPQMNSDFYPSLSAHLSETYPKRYNRRPFLLVWKTLVQHSIFANRSEVLSKNPANTLGEQQQSGG